MRLFFAAAVVSAFSFSDAAPITLVGSDLIAPVIKKSVSTLAEKDGVELKIDMTGSFVALDKLRNGSADIAIIGLPREQKIPEEFAAIPFAYQAAIVVVNVVNPLEEISTAQLRDIFAKNAINRIETWEQMGIGSAGNMRNILPVVTSFNDGVALELFKYSCFKGDNIAPWVSVVQNKSDIYNIVKTNNSAIAVIGKLKPDHGALKVVAVSEPRKDSERGYAFKPEPDILYNNDYPMSLPFYIVYKKGSASKIKGLIRLLLDDKLARDLEGGNFFSVSKNFRKKSVLELDMAQ